MKRVSILLFLVGCSVTQALRISTFNIEWFGYGGKNPFRVETSFRDEFRDYYLRDYIEQTLEDSDVIVFTEIVNVPRFERNVVPERICHTYFHRARYHQHILLCHKKEFQFTSVWGDSNLELEQIALNPGKSRPGLWGVLREKNGKAIAIIIGVHLKAYPNRTEMRLKQIRSLSRTLSRRRDSLPYILIGDFNTHFAKDTGLAVDDVTLMGRIFEVYNLNLSYVRNPYAYTYRDGSQRFKLDQVWMSQSLQANDTQVAPPCKRGTLQGGFHNLKYYNRVISDHCPLSTTVN